MIDVTKMGAQGDVLFRRVAALPEGAKQIERKGALVVAHSETGHNHVINTSGVAFFETSDPFVGFLRLEGPCAEVEHMRPHDTHETLRLIGEPKGPAFFEVRRQREHAPEGYRMVAD